MTEFIATIAKGIEDLLVTELRELGIESKPMKAGVRFEGDLEQAYRVCLWSRLANRVLLVVHKAPVTDDDALYAEAQKIDWRQHLAGDHTFAVAASTARSNITHSKYAALRVKDAIVDQFRDATGARPDVAVDKPDVQVNVFIDRNEAQLAIDLSGESLHLRGYRNLGGLATLKENLAAALLCRAGWPEKAGRGEAFVDFMCGSGTLPIEAAMIACDIAPGLQRDYFGLLGWAGHNAAVWERLVTEAEYRKEKGLKQAPTIQGFDHHRPTLEKARQHVTNAGLEGIVKIEYQDVREFNLDFPKQGLVLVNAPYGNRVGEMDELESLYQAIGKVMRENFQGWRGAVFTDALENGKAVGIRADKIHSFFNGAIECKLISFDISPETEIKQYRLPRLFAVEELSDAALGFQNRLKKNRQKLKGWLKQSGVTCYRVYDADLPDYSAAIDVYKSDRGEKIWLHVQEYEAPKSIDPAKAKRRLSELLSVVKLAFDIPAEQIFLKSRKRQKGDSQYEKLAEEKHFHIVEEGSCKFRVNFEDYLDTGLFLDHRPIRLQIAKEMPGKRLLNLFAYTSAVTVHAAVGGAEASVSVDMSNTYLDWSRHNFRLNGIDLDAHQLVRADCLGWLNKVDVADKFDVIFLDPPSFSNSKKMDDTLDVQRDHVELIEKSARLLADDGVLYFSNNLRGFKLDHAALAAFDIEDITAQTLPPDFQQRKHIHQCWKIKAG